MGKKRRQDQNEKASMPRDEMPLEEGTADTSPSSIRDVLMQFKEVIQVKVNTDECLQKLEETVKKLVDKVKRLQEKMKRNKIKEVKEDLKTELILLFQEQMQKLEEKVENKSKEHFSMLTKDFKKEPEEVKEEPYFEMQKEGSSKGNRCTESSSLRLQQNQSQKTSFHLKFVSKMEEIVYKGKPIGTIEVALYDGDNPIAPDHHLASALVELVVVDGEFGGQIQQYWSKDEFVQGIMKSRQGNYSKGEPPNVPVRKSRFNLVDGTYRPEGVVITENSNRKDVKLGVMIVGNTEERVLEGVSNCFRVQEAKTERGKRITDETPEDLPRFTGQNNSHVRNKKGNGSVGPLPSEPLQYHTQEDATQQESYGQGQQHIFPSTTENVAPMANPLKRKNAHTTGNGLVGQTLVAHLQQHNINQQENHEAEGQQYSIPTTQPINFQNIPDPSIITYPYAAGNGSVPLETSHYPTQQDTTQLGSYGKGPQHSFPPAKHNFTPMPNQLQRINTHTEANVPGGEPVVFHLKQQNTTHHEDHVGQVKQNIPPTTGPINAHNMLSWSGMTYHHTSGQVKKHFPPKVGPINFQNQPSPPGIIYHHTSGTLPLDPSQYPTRQDVTGAGSYAIVQSPQNTFLRVEPNFGIISNQSQKIHAPTTGYGPGGEPLVYHPQQQNTTQQGAIQQKDHGHGQQYMKTRTQPISFHNMSHPSQIPYHHTTGPLTLDPLQYRTQQDLTGVGSYETVQGPQNTFRQTEDNSGIVLNQLQKIAAHAAGNGPGNQPLVEHVQQQNNTQQGSTMQEDHGPDLGFNKDVEGSSTDITSISPFADNAFEDEVVYREAMRRFRASGCSPDHPVAPEDTYQDGGAIDPSAAAPESTMEFTN